MIEVACALIVNDGRVLVAQNGLNSDHALQWEFPGGKLHSGESAAECIVREIWEELAVTIQIKKEVVPVEHDYGLKKIRLIPFICTIKSGKVKLNEHLAVKWVNYEELWLEDLSEADMWVIMLPENKRFLKEYAGK